MDASYVARVHAVWRRLGVPPDYCERRGLPLQAEAAVLVAARRLPNGREIQLAPRAAAAWTALHAAAEAQGGSLLLISGVRSVDRQTAIIEKRLADGSALEAILEVNAAPGCSEHHTGRAVDIGTPGCPPLTETFEETQAYAWLAREAPALGFHLSYPRGNPHGIVYEPWHWLWSDPAPGAGA